uniref:Putative conserved secreted protein n=1 Tax=Rhipicephalus microplus TaxID=6941 RepID=A0A6M2CGX4_RHIMP
MKAYAILGLLILGHLCYIQAATQSKPATSADETTKSLTEKLSRSFLEHREELLEALQGIDSTGDKTDEQVLPVLLVPIITAIAEGLISGAVGAGVGIAVSKG